MTNDNLIDKEITKYFREWIIFLDGNGLVITDEELIDAKLHFAEINYNWSDLKQIILGAEGDN